MVEFATFYAALNSGREPFPWQQRLANQVVSSGAWPSEIGIPTGLGKTACLDIGVWALAHAATQPPAERTTPTRIWWLVNRRILVDATASHAEHISRALASPGCIGDPTLRSAVERVADQVKTLWPAGDRPIEVVRLRGGAAFGRPTNPAQPAIVLSTIPMYGSRLLFRGYGTSRSMRPLDAALAGTDSLVLVDEAHLAHHLMEMFEPLAECDKPTEQILATRSRPVVVSLTATGAAPLAQRFDLDEKDRSNPVVSQRLAAAKPLTIATAEEKKLVAVLSGAVTDLVDSRQEPTSCVVFVNSPARAQEVHHDLVVRLRRSNQDVTVALLTGRMREREAAAARELLLDPVTGAKSGHSADRSNSLIVVATQTLEVGADLDFEFLVTEACGTRALVQRLGRLNRLGRFAGAKARYVHWTPKASKGTEPQWPVYGSEPAIVLKRLRTAQNIEGVVGVSPGDIRGVLGEPDDDPGVAPAIVPALLWEWAKTSAPAKDEAPVEPYFSGLRRPDIKVSICWRAHIPAPGDRVWPLVRDQECIDIPIGEAREALAEVDLVRLGPDRDAAEPCTAEQLRPGDTVLIPTDTGLLDNSGWNPKASAVVFDIATYERGLPLDAVALGRLADVEATKIRLLVAKLVTPDDGDEVNEGDVVSQLVSHLRSAAPRSGLVSEWNDLVDSIDTVVERPHRSVAYLALRGAIEDARVDELDEFSLAATVNLDRHGHGVAKLARETALHLGIGAELCTVIEMAARFHDVGKADTRFQRWLDPLGKTSAPVAKSDRPRTAWASDRVASGWPKGGRHEELSRRLVAQWLSLQPPGLIADPELLEHLVVAHHGHGRPLLAATQDNNQGDVWFTLDGTNVTVDRDLSRQEWGQPKRFRYLTERYGLWGLALLECIVRQSDHQVSSGSLNFSLIGA